MARDESFWTEFEIDYDGTEYPVAIYPTEAAAVDRGMFRGRKAVYEMPFVPFADDARFFLLTSSKAPRRRRSWLDVPSGDADVEFFDSAPERLTREAALAEVARLNAATNGDEWWFAVEIGEPLTHRLNSTMFLRAGQCGELRTSTFTPIRIVRPTKDERQRYVIPAGANC